MTPGEVRTIADVDVLWQALRSAKSDRDYALVRAIEQRMRELSTDRRFSHLSDDELDARIASLAEHREATDMIGHSPGGAGLGGGDAPHTSALNQAIRSNQRTGIEETRGALLDELARRQPPDAE